MTFHYAGNTPDLPGATHGTWGITPFYVQRGPHQASQQGAAFEFRAPTTSRNALRVLRALQLKRSVLLEGSPGVGKTALIAALASATGQALILLSVMAYLLRTCPHTFGQCDWAHPDTVSIYITQITVVMVQLPKLIV